MEERDLYEKMETWLRAKPGRTQNQLVMGMNKRLTNDPSGQSALPDAVSGAAPVQPVEVTEELLERLARQSQAAASHTSE